MLEASDAGWPFSKLASMVFLASSTLFFFMALFQAPPAPFLAFSQASHVEAVGLLSGLLSFKPLWGLGSHWLCAKAGLPLLFLLLQLRPFSRPRGGLVPGLELPFLEILLVLEIFLIPVKLSLLLQIFLCEGIDFVPPCEPSLILSGAGLVSGLCPWRYACLLAWTAGSEFLRSFLAHLLARPRLSCQPSFKPEAISSWILA